MRTKIKQLGIALVAALLSQINLTAQTLPINLTIEKEIVIDAPIDKSWEVLGPQFADAYKWSSAVNHSQGVGVGTNGASCSERACSTTMGALKEKIIEYSSDKHLVYYQAYDGMPKMIKYATNTWQVIDLGNGKSQLKMKMDFNVGGMMGKMMKGMMKKKLSKLGTQLANDFKYYVENGKPTAEKQKAIAKYNSKTKHS